MNKRKIIGLALLFSASLLTGTYISQDAYAGDVYEGSAYNGGAVTQAGGSCFKKGSSTNYNSYYDSCFGFTWRKYTYNGSDDVTFYGIKETGGNSIVGGECGQTGGFYYLGWEAFDPHTYTSLGYQRPNVTLGQVNSKSYYTKRNVSTSGTTGKNSKNLKGSPVSWSEAESAYNAAISTAKKYSSSGSWEDFNSESNNTTWFCYKERPVPTPDNPEPEEPEAPPQVVFQGKSTVSLSNGQFGTVAYNSTGGQRAVSGSFEYSEDGDNKITVSFEHWMRQISGDSSISNYSSTYGSGTYTGTSEAKVAYGSQEVTLSPKTQQQVCDSLTFFNGKEEVTNEVCAIIDTADKEYNVTFVGTTEVKAGADIEAIADNGEKYIIRADDILTGQSIKIIGDSVNLRFQDTITRTDDNAEVAGASTYYIVTHPSLTPTGSSLRNFRDNIKGIGGFNSLRNGKLKYDDKNYPTLETLLNFPITPKLKSGDSAMVHNGNGDFEIPSGKARQICQVLAYVPSNEVDEDGNSVFLKQSITTGANLFVDIAKFFACIINKLANSESSTTEDASTSCGTYITAALQDIIPWVKTAVKKAINFIDQVFEGNYGLSYACVSIEQALDFQLTPTILVNQDIALVGEDVTANIDQSKIVSKSYKNPGVDNPTDTSNLVIQAVRFIVPANIAADDSQLFTGTSETEENACTYYGNKITEARDSCRELSKTENQQILSNNTTKAESSLRELGFASNDLKYNVEDLPVGTKICFALGVQDANSESYNNKTNLWAISGATCRTVAKKPSLSITGGSMYTGGDVTTSTTQKTPLGDSDNKIFGSWVEYGAVANGDIEYNGNKGFASGNVFKNGILSSNSKLGNNPLTIANNDTNTFGKSGVVFNSKLRDKVEKVFKNATTNTTLQSNCAEKTGCYYNATSIDYTVGITGSHIIYNNGDITINGNIEYTRNATLDNLPQVIIISDGNINVTSGVTRVDAWLVAKGRINTCSDQGEPGDDTLYADSCSQLVINGPVISKGPNNNYRTAGSGVGGDSAIPAEVFNLPASTYAWSYSMARELSDNYYQAYVTELAPRE